MEQHDDNESVRNTDSGTETDADETTGLIASGRNAGNRSGALGLLVVVLVIAMLVYYHFSASGVNSFLSRLDSDLLAHAELTLASQQEGNRLAVVPSWPTRLYTSLRNDIALYIAVTLAAAYVWGLSVRARARRDLYLVHKQLTGEIASLRERLDKVDNSGTNPDTE